MLTIGLRGGFKEREGGITNSFMLQVKEETGDYLFFQRSS